MNVVSHPTTSGISSKLFRRFAPTSTLPPTIRQLLLQQHISKQPTRVQVKEWVESIRKRRGKFECLGECDPDMSAMLRSKLTMLQEYPVQKQDISVKYLRDHCHLRARTPRLASMLRLRDQTQRTLHGHFKRNFTYVYTPVLTANDCEGAGEVFRVQSSNHPTPSENRKESFDRAAYLTVSSQLHLEALSTSLSRVYTLSPCFCAERSQTGRHLSEFWMLEAEWAFTQSVSEVCRVVEDSVESALQQRSEDLALLRQSFLEGADNSQKPWGMVPYGDVVKALEKYQAATRKFYYEPSWGEPLHSEHGRLLSEHLVEGPVFMTDYACSLKPFYMRINDDDRTVASFDLLVPYLGELVGGSLREEWHNVLWGNLGAHNLDPEDFSWYLDFRKDGGAPHEGCDLDSTD
ncbi:class II aaRS and biotin synthetase [Panus rudis PR-1116 ss-1]|nr:class II aaRS and biotin synthetase [Panus rudis PR-1116 ss-1]